MESVMLTRRTALMGTAITALMISTTAMAGESNRETGGRGCVLHPAGTKFWAMTFDGSMPGPMMVLHEGDYMELTLVNPETNSMPHNIDLHSATGGLGGGALTKGNPCGQG